MGYYDYDNYNSNSGSGEGPSQNELHFNEDGTYSYVPKEGGSGGNGQGPKPRRKAPLFLKVIAIALVFGLVAGSVSYGTFRAGAAIFGPVATGNAGISLGGNNISGTAVSTATTVTDVSDIVTNTLPGIVQVTNVSVREYTGFFGQTYVQTTPTAGTGFIIGADDDNIYIATNHHVVSNSKEITITFFTDEAVSGQLKGSYPDRDVAVVLVKKSDISPETLEEIKVVALGDSDTLMVGEGAVVIGNSLGYGISVTTGVISALNREVSARDDSSGAIITNEKLIQTDAAVNGGNSGGPLLNMKGEVIGIVSVKYVRTDVEGVGYAIPISDAFKIIEELIKTGNYTEDYSESGSNSGNGAYLGIYGGMDIDSQTASMYNMPTGVYVSQVVEGSGAEKAGIARGDVIRGLDGVDITSMTTLRRELGKHNPGDTVVVTVAIASKGYTDIDLRVTLQKNTQEP